MAYLMDSNVIIEYLSDLLPEKASAMIGTLPINISLITKMEILGWYQINAGQLLLLEQFMGKATIFDINSAIVAKTINIRQTYRIKLPDAIIAATSLVTGARLITRNVRDFEKIAGLVVLDSHVL